MKQNELKSYDIALFEVEQEYNKQIAPIEKKIEKLNSQHESKSLSSHKDFLAKDKKSKDLISTLNEKNIVRFQRIERAVENKLTKLKNKKSRYTEILDLYKEEKDVLRNEELELVNKNIEHIQLDEQRKINDIKTKFQTNIESYLEKLDIYNSNFNKNKEFHESEIACYQTKLEEQLTNIEQFHTQVMASVSERLEQQINARTEKNNYISTRNNESIRQVNQIGTSIRKQVNTEIDAIHKYIEDLKVEESKHYQVMITELSNQTYLLRTSFEERRLLIEQDLEMNVSKQNVQLETAGDTITRKAKRNIGAKIELFTLRASTVIKYEESLLEEQINLIEQEIHLLRERLNDELLNIDKLQTFLVNDENQTKDVGTYFKELNTVLRNELSNFEYTNNDYTKKHSELKAEFNRTYIKIFKTLKETLISVAQTHLNKMSENNFKLDEINRFLDTAEPQKEIKVNKLREDIEINEIKERYKIKYAKEQFDLNMINDKYDAIIIKEEEKTKELISEVQFDINEIRNKETFDKAVETSKLKQSEAQEVYKLRLNNTRLERNLLTNKYKNEIDILELQKELKEISVRKHNALLTKELEFRLSNYQLEIKYQSEVIKKGLEETLLNLEEKVLKVNFEKDAFLSKWHSETTEELEVLLSEKQDVIESMEDKRDLVKVALERELKEPSQNKLRTEAIIDERLSKLDISNAHFVDYLRDTIDTYRDDLLSAEQLREVIINNESLQEKAEKYVSKSYQVLREAVEFMNDIEKHSILNKLASTADVSKTRKLNKQLQKQLQESLKQIEYINTSEKDHKLVHRNYIENEITKIKKANIEDNMDLVNITENTYYQIFDKLKTLQANVKTETETLYKTLTKNDTEIVLHAKKNADTALHKIDLEEKERITPHDLKIETFKQNKDNQKNEFVNHFDQELSDLKAEISHLKNDALSQTKDKNSEKLDLISLTKEKQKVIGEDEDAVIAKEKEHIDVEIKALEENYQDTLNRIDMKDTEAKKIYNYEDRIYNIAVDNATSRYNEANSKAKNIHIENAKAYHKHTIQAEKTVETNNKNYNKKLLVLTKQFERNIFTTRPRLEESIGDAQKEIDQETSEQKKLAEELLLHNEKLVDSCENILYTSFSEGYDKLQENLTTYIDKYRVIEQEFISKNQSANDSITTNNLSFSQALFEMSKNKHEKNVQELLNINQNISKEEAL
jgi:hypothetical protein